MSQTAVMRTGKDRLRYTLAFEASLMIILIPAGAAFFGKGLADIGLLGIVLALKAMLVNLIYNWLFDHFDARANRISSDRSTIGRIVHAAGFETTLMITSLPIYMWWLNVTLLQAFMTDVVVTSLIVVYTYGFTLGYDRLFPVVRTLAPVTPD